ncbi:MAG: 16S rRNA (uracil(1498)-N(3))-methyltransferase [Candidatus Eremiobacteraeota bacterium]|nr:16S rRNA (uracil(1498)-N(3))-methyltransferase [Candidatus Eremiobacteraeota bacterium]
MKTARRFFVEGTHEIGNVIAIDGSDARKIARVLRLSPGDRIEIVDSAASAFAASIASVGRDVRATLLERRVQSWPTALRIDVAQAVPKGRRMDFVVEKGTELGASAFLPFYCERGIGRASAEKLDRWRRIARASAQQSGRLEVPEVNAPIRYDALLALFNQYDRVVFAWELAETSVREALAAALPGAQRLLLVVGPEGGFTHAEADAAERRGAAMTSLGARILRTDTAAVALLAVISAFAS